MRYILIIFLLFFSDRGMASKCPLWWIRVMTDNVALNRNSVVILEFFSVSQEKIPLLNKTYRVSLRSDQDTVTLLPVETLYGAFEVTQVVFKPATLLLPNQDYEIAIDGVDRSEFSPSRYNSQLQKSEKIIFKTSDKIDTAIATATDIRFDHSEKMSYGSDPYTWAYFKVSGTSEANLFIRANVRNKSSRRTVSYILPIENGMVKIGHTMCYVPFDYDPSAKYEVRFSLFDSSCNEGPVGKPILFSVPRG